MKVVRVYVLFCCFVGILSLDCLLNGLTSPAQSFSCGGISPICLRKGGNSSCIMNRTNTDCQKGPGCYGAACCCSSKKDCNDQFCVDHTCPPEKATLKCKTADDNNDDVNCPVDSFCVRIAQETKEGKTTVKAGCGRYVYQGPGEMPPCDGVMAGCLTRKEWGLGVTERCCCTTSGCNDKNCTRRACPCTKDEQL